MNKVKGKCKICGGDHYINSRMVCKECVFKENHNGLSRVSYKIIKKSNALKKDNGVKRNFTFKKIRKPTGELALFFEIWGEREHICSHCGTGLVFTTNIKYFVKYFSHIRSKGAAPELRLVKSNIELLCHKCHDEYEFGDRARRAQ